MFERPTRVASRQETFDAIVNDTDLTARVFEDSIVTYTPIGDEKI